MATNNFFPPRPASWPTIYACEDTTMALTNGFAPPSPFTFVWNSVPGQKYAVMETANLHTWSTNKFIKATGIKTSFSAPVSSFGPPRFYRIKQVPP